MSSTVTEEVRMVAVVRLRGTPGLRHSRRDTLAMLRLHKPNHAVIIPLTSTYRGMLMKVKDVVTWGEVSEETLEYLLRKRGRVTGNEKLTDEWVKENVPEVKNIAELAKKIYKGELLMKNIEGLKPLFRLHPARKGFKKFTRDYTDGGDLGFRGEAINELLKRMA